MKWPEEEKDENGYPGHYRKTADATVAQYLNAPWRKAAVRSARKHTEELFAKAEKNGLPEPPDLGIGLRCLASYEHNLPDVVAVILQDDAHNGISITGAILVEAAGTLFLQPGPSDPVRLEARRNDHRDTDPVGAARARRIDSSVGLSKRPGLREDPSARFSGRR